MAAPIPLCSLEFANLFIGAHRWKDNWVAAGDTEKNEALVNATQVILQFCKFPKTGEDVTAIGGGTIVVDETLPPDGEGIEYIDYTPASTDDPNVPDWLRQACCYEALYFFDLENDPARPFPLGILGIIKDNKTTFDHNYEPPLFSMMCRSLLENNGAIVEDPYLSANDWAARIKL